MAFKSSELEKLKRREEKNTVAREGKRSPEQFNQDLVPSSSTEKLEGLCLVPLEKLRTFQDKGDGDFSPLDDHELQQMADTMDEYGPNEPIIVRQLPNMMFEILSGEQRYRACKLKGIKKVRAFIQRNCSDKKAKEIFLIQNLSRRKDRISDKIYGWKQFSDLNEGRIGEALKEVSAKDSYTTVYSYVKCANLIKEIVREMDNGKVSLRSGYQLAFLLQSEQRILLPYIARIIESDAKNIRKASEEGALSEEWLENYFNCNSDNTTVVPPSFPQPYSNPAYTSPVNDIHPNYELAKKKSQIYEKHIRKGMRKIRLDIIDKISPSHYEDISVIISDALDLYLRTHSEFEITENDKSELERLKMELNEMKETESTLKAASPSMDVAINDEEILSQ